MSASVNTERREVPDRGRASDFRSSTSRTHVLSLLALRSRHARPARHADNRQLDLILLTSPVRKRGAETSEQESNKRVFRRTAETVA